MENQAVLNLPTIEEMETLGVIFCYGLNKEAKKKLELFVKENLGEVFTTVNIDSTASITQAERVGLFQQMKIMCLVGTETTNESEDVSNLEPACITFFQTSENKTALD